MKQGEELGRAISTYCERASRGIIRFPFRPKLEAIFHIEKIILSRQIVW